MTEWEPFRLGDALSVSHGFAFKGEFFCDEGDLVVLTPGNFLEQGGFKPKSGKEKYYEGPFPDRFLLAKSQVVVAMTEQSKGLLGSTATVPANNRYLHNQRIGLLNITDPLRLDLRFTYHLLNAPSVRQQIQATATGSKVRHTAPDRIESIIAPIPNIECQRRIGRALDNFDDLIENNRRRIEILEAAARLLYLEWFVHFRFPGHEDVAMIDSDLGPIPEGWSVTLVGDAIETVGGGTPSKGVEEYWEEGTVQWFTPTDLTRSRSAFTFGSESKITKLGLKKSSAKLFPADSVMMTSRATIGVISISTTSAATNQGFITCVPSEYLPSSYLYFWLHANVDLFLSLAGGATFKELRKSTFRELPILIPDSGVMGSFQQHVGPLMELMRNLLEQNEVLKEARDLLLPRLVSGELDVSEFDLGLEVVGA